MVIASAYFPGNVNVMPMNWSHGVNKRGESLSDYVVLCWQLEVANVGCKPTFNNAIREESLDLTLVSNSIVSSLVN